MERKTKESKNKGAKARNLKKFPRNHDRFIAPQTKIDTSTKKGLF
jgi:hypothetical protein